MPTSNTSYGEKTPGETVTTAFSAQAKNKIILITGVNAGGIGSTTASALAAQSPKLLVLAGRNQAKVQEVIDNLKKDFPNVPTKFLKLDLSSQQSCRTAAKEIIEATDVPHIDILINNAGVMAIPERQLSADGIEMQFATNHIGHFLFTNLIMPKILKAAQSNSKGSTRIVNVSSMGMNYSPIRFSDINLTKHANTLPQSEQPNAERLQFRGEPTEGDYISMVAYGQSKTANVLFSVELTKLLYEKYGVLSFGLHPGAIKTELGRYTDQAELKSMLEKFEAAGVYFKALDEGASTSLVAALDPKLTSTDVYLSDCQSVDWAPKWATDPIVADKLWKLSEDLVGEKFSY